MHSLCALVLLALAPPVTAQTWPERKCAIFTDAWTQAAPTGGPSAPSPDFRTRIEAFIAAGCNGPRDACPATDADIALADLLSLIVVSEGMSTTFLPIGCPSGQAGVGQTNSGRRLP